MEKDQYGIWEVIIPPNSDGTCAIPHNSKIKVRLFLSTLGAGFDVIEDHDDHLF